MLRENPITEETRPKDSLVRMSWIIARVGGWKRYKSIGWSDR